MTIKGKIKSFFLGKIDFSSFGVGKPASPSLFVFYLPTSDKTLKIDKNLISSFGGTLEKQRVVSFLTPEVVRSEELTISKFIPPAELASNIEIKAFDELSLDAEMDYKVVHEPNETLSEKRTDQYAIYNTYITSALEADGYFALALQKTKYIDSVSFAPLAFRRFYKEGYLSDNKTYALVYMYKNLSFLSIYEGHGELMYTKVLKVTIDGYYEKYCDTVGDKIAFNDFLKLFCGVISSESSTALIGEYRVEIFKAFSDVLTHAKRLLGFEKYDTIFVSSEYGDLVGIDELGKQYFETPIKHLNFKLPLFGDSVDALTGAMILDAIDGTGLEFTTHTRPLPIMQRKSGMLLALSIVSLVVFSLAPLLKYALLSENTAKLQKEYDRVGAKQKEAQMLIGQKNEELKRLEAQIAAEKNISMQNHSILLQLAKTKESSSAVSPMMVKIANTAYASGVKFDSIDINGTSAQVIVKSSSASALTQFVKNLSNTGLKAKSSGLKKEENSTLYIGQVEASK